MFKMQISIYVYDGIVSDLDAWIVGILHGKLLNSRRIVGRIIFCKVAHIASQFHV